MRGDLVGKTDEKELKQLRAKVRELELLTSTQTKLIEILKSMPGCQGVTLKDEKPKRISARAQTSGGAFSEDGSKGEHRASRKPSRGHDESVKGVEDKV
jgi:hypothetical protein